MESYITWLRERSIFIMLGIGLIYLIFKPYLSKGHIQGLLYNYKYRRQLKAIKKNKDAIFEEQYPNGIMKYSIEDSIRFGFREEGTKKPVKRPAELVRKRKGFFDGRVTEKEKLMDSRYANALKREIPLSFLYEKEAFKNKTIRVYIEDIYDTVATLRDYSATYKLNLQGTYGGAGEFVLINLTKKGDEIKINYILKDF
jgi:hypothetical protein